LIRKEIAMGVVGFDLEIYKELPGGDWRPHRPLGITCAAIVGESDSGGEIVSVFPDDPEWTFNQMPTHQAEELAVELVMNHDQGNRLVTWNGLGFDFPVLLDAVESQGLRRRLAEIALDHIDMAFVMLCDKGFMISLNKAAQGLGLSGKTEGMSGSLAPILWNKPERGLTVNEQYAIDALHVEPGTQEARDLCLEYVTQDSRATYEVYQALVEDGALFWETRRGTQSKYPWVPFITNGHLPTCREAYQTEEPDTSWMTDPWPRERFIGWALEMVNDN
jgi:hypothetical protein